MLQQAANLKLLLESCKELAVRPGVEVILVDNGSTDGTAEALLDLLPQYLDVEAFMSKKIKGTALESYLASRRLKAKFWDGRMLICKLTLKMRKGLDLFEKHGDDIFVRSALRSTFHGHCFHCWHECVRNFFTYPANVGHQCPADNVSRRF